MVAATLGAAAVFATHWILMWTLSGSHYGGWPTSVAVGVIIALAVIRMTRERFLPLEKNVFSRGIARVYAPTLRWILAHKAVFLIVPFTVLGIGLFVWSRLGREFAA